MFKHFLKKQLPPGLRYDIRKWLTLTGHIFTDIYLYLRYGKVLKKHSREKVDLLINFGCGPNLHPGWINIDKSTNKGVYYHDLRNPIPLCNNSVLHINAEHFLEHLEIFYAKKFLSECHRILKPGGTIRISVPDAERYIDAYYKNNTEFFEPLVNLGGSSEKFQTKIEIINQMFRMADSHLFAWDFETLELYVRTSKFVNIKRSEYKSGDFNIDGNDWWRPHESLYIVAQKQIN